MNDLRYGIRMLAKDPGVTLAAILALALGIGANTAIFSVVDAALLRPLPYADPDRLMRVWETNPSKGWTEHQLSLPNFADWRERSKAFVAMAAYGAGGAILSNSGEPEPIVRTQTAGDLIGVLGVPPELGRGFSP